MGIETVIAGAVIGGSMLHSSRQARKERKAGQIQHNEQIASYNAAAQENALQQQRLQQQQAEYNVKLADSRKTINAGMTRNRRRVRGGGFGESKTLYKSADVQQPGLNPRLG